MGKVTTKLQITLPKLVAAQFHIRPGDEIDFVPAGDVIRLVSRKNKGPLGLEARLELFDKVTERLSKNVTSGPRELTDRGWTREELYDRDRTH